MHDFDTFLNINPQPRFVWFLAIGMILNTESTMTKNYDLPRHDVFPGEWPEDAPFSIFPGEWPEDAPFGIFPGEWPEDAPFGY